MKTASFSDVLSLSEEYNLPVIEVVILLINLFGVRVELPFRRVRFVIIYGQDLMMSVENSCCSPFFIHDGYLWIDQYCLRFPIAELVEDRCEVIYTRNKGRVISFNPNNRSSCSGCRFCYQPSSNDQRVIRLSSIRTFFERWMADNGLSSLSRIIQVALVTGCFSVEEEAIDYLIKMREVLTALGFEQEILYLGMLRSTESIRKLSEIKPLHLCFTLECLENRKSMLKPEKCIDIGILLQLMEFATSMGIDTSFTYIVGLDSFESIRKNFEILKNYVTRFPLVSIYQTDSFRERLRAPEAEELSYYFKSREIIQRVFNGSQMSPNSWSNYRSLWRTCYGLDNERLKENLI